MSAIEAEVRQSEVWQHDYENHGVCVIRGLFSAADAETIRAQWRDTANDSRWFSLTRAAQFVFGAPPGPIGSVWKHPRLVEVMQKLLGEDVALYMNRLLLKNEKWAGSVPIHQDMAYLNGQQRKVSAFVPLQPVGRRNGGTRFAGGSHRLGLLERSTSLAPGMPPELPPGMKEVVPEMDVGDVLLFDILTWHWSEEAQVKNDRPQLQIVYQPATDGSYAGPAFGVSAPQLVCGQWRTQDFTQLRSEHKRVGADEVRPVVTA
jgi:Phytanoyl-CoA dioxygenase (PhyH)